MPIICRIVNNEAGHEDTNRQAMKSMSFSSPYVEINMSHSSNIVSGFSYAFSQINKKDCLKDG